MKVDDIILMSVDDHLVERHRRRFRHRGGLSTAPR